jgi:sterol desaturase/sphingolipid hydroxylase (fatty acid hydroxylase superfamily)
MLILHILGYDIWFYASHRLLHTKYLWSIHKIHHEKRYPTIWDTNYAHWSEGIIQSIGILLPFLLYYPNWIEFIIACVFTNMRGHARHDPRMIWLLGNHHMLHHELGNVNYGDYYIDCLFGTCDKKFNKRIAGLSRI